MLILAFVGCSTNDGEGIGPEDPFGGHTRQIAGSDEEIPPIELGAEYSDYNRTRHGSVNRPKEVRSTWEEVALYLPNRILDLIDVVKADVGVGPTTGVVVRATKFAQAGVRVVSPFSVRVGPRGRYLPLWLESSSELGISPAFRQSSDRIVGSGEFGAGLDLLLVGAYLGVDLLELGDFVLGVFMIDLKEDDL